MNKRLDKIVNNLTVAMQCALIEARNHGHSAGLQWIYNTLEGTGNLPDMDECESADAYFKKHAIK